MTLKQIRGMFAVGEEWTAVNTYNAKVSGPRVLPYGYMSSNSSHEMR
jgi:hypothetical protein